MNLSNLQTYIQVWNKKPSLGVWGAISWAGKEQFGDS
jgi:hypothetical protein